jgi:microcystin-dependent protein
MNTTSTGLHTARALARTAAALAAAVTAGAAMAQAGGSTIDKVWDAIAELRASANASLAVPVGGIVAYGGVIDDKVRQSLLAQGWMPCDGALLQEADYPDLHKAIGTAFGGSKDAKSFRLPDLRGRFLRGTDGGAGNDPDAKSRVASAEGGHVGDNVGSKQDDALVAHVHMVRMDKSDAARRPDFPSNSYLAAAYDPKRPTEPAGGAETRPRNIGVHWLIRVLKTLPPPR